MSRKNLLPIISMVEAANHSFEQFKTLKENWLSNKVIFLLDYDEAFTRMLINQLHSFHYEVHHFTCLQSLNQASRSLTPFANLINIRCLQLSNEKRLNNQLLSALTIITTESESFLDQLYSIRVGGDYCINKPFQIEELIDRFDDYNESIKLGYVVLLVEPCIETSMYYKSLLEKTDMTVYVLSNPANIYRALVDGKPDLVLIGMDMSQCTGLELVAMIRQNEKYTSLPIIILSRDYSSSKQWQAMSLGAECFIPNSTKPEYIQFCVKNFAERYRFINKLIAKDSLTGVLNHSTVQKRLQETIKEADRLKFPIAVAMVDLDNFKEINDQYGHIQGDQVLKNLCLLMRKRLRETDIIGRYGGEEFLIIFPNTTAKQAKMILNDIRASFASLTHMHNGIHFYVTFSAGISEYPIYSCSDDLIQSADKYLYKAKEHSRNMIWGN